MKIRILSIILLLVLLLTACQSSYKAAPGLSLRMTKEIEAAFTENGLAPEYGMTYVWEGEKTTLLYYGTFEEWIIIERCYGTYTANYGSLYIGKHYFGEGSGGTTRLFAYKDSELLHLEVAYESGLISDASVAEIAKQYIEINEARRSNANSKS